MSGSLGVVAAPKFVPLDPLQQPRDYESAPWRMDPWFTDRPGDFAEEPAQPDRDAGGVGAPGPDQGYALKLSALLRPELAVSRDENVEDAERAVVAIGLKRASIFSRAPIITDLRIAATVWGLLDPQPPADLVAERAPRIEGLRHWIETYPRLRAIVDTVPVKTLARPLDELTAAHRADWRSLLVL